MVSMQILFPVCVEVLRDALEPLHYAELTKRALDILNIRVDFKEFLRLKEDVREKLLLANRYGTAYIVDAGDAYCVGVLSQWFMTNQLALFNGEWEGLRIHGSAAAGFKAAFELIKRRPHMITKQVENDQRELSAAFGIIIEEHVSQWVHEQWPMFWRPPENFQQWARPCNHDFRLRLKDRMVEVDVMGPKGRGENGLLFDVTTKKPADIHLCASIHKKDVVLHGFMPRNRLRATWEAHETLPISWFIVWLNCQRLGYDYAAIRSNLQ